MEQKERHGEKVDWRGGLYKLSARKRNIIAERGREGIEKRGKGGHSEVKK